MGSRDYVSFALMGFGGKLEALSNRLSSERERAMRSGRHGRERKTDFPAGFVSRTIWDAYFGADAAEAAPRRKWRPPTERWLEHREEARAKAWKRVPWVEGETEAGEGECRRADGRGK